MAYGDRLSKNFGRIVRLRMMTASIKQEQLGRALGRSQSHVSRCLSGARAVTLQELPAIAALLDTTPGDLLEEAWSATVKELGEPTVGEVEAA